MRGRARQQHSVGRATARHQVRTNQWLRVCRGRWDVIEAKVAQQKELMAGEMQQWMDDTVEGLRAEYELRVAVAVSDALAGRTAGAQSDAQQPDMA